MDTRMTKRRNFSDKFKASVALRAQRGDKTEQQIAARHQLHPMQVSMWYPQAIERIANVFSDKVKKAEDKIQETKILQNWPEVLRCIATMESGRVQPSHLGRQLQEDV